MIAERVRSGAGGGGGDGDGARLEVEELLDTSRLDQWDLVYAALVVVLGAIGARYAGRATSRVLQGVQGLSEDLRRLAARVVRVFVFVVGLGVALGILGAPIRPVLAAAVIVSVVAALSLRGVAENFSAGLVLQARQPLRVGDQVEVLGHQGVVGDVNSRSVVLDTFDGAVVHLPNRSVLDEPLVNLSAHGARRSELEARWRTDRPAADRERIVAALRALDDVLDEPAPVVLVVAHDADRLTVRVQFWHAPQSGVLARSAAVEAVAATLAEVDPERAVITPPPPPPFTPPPAR